MENEQVAVEQCDKDAAQSILWVETIIDDVQAIEQAFARHRTRALEASQAGAGEADQEDYDAADKIIEAISCDDVGTIRDLAVSLIVQRRSAALTTPTRIEASDLAYVCDACTTGQYNTCCSQEAVAWMYEHPDMECGGVEYWAERQSGYGEGWIETPLYATPPQAAESGLLDTKELARCLKLVEDWAFSLGATAQGEASWPAKAERDLRRVAKFLTKAGKPQPGEAGNGES